MQEKLILPLADVTKLAKCKTLGVIQNAIKVHMSQKSYLFTSFNKRDTTYKYMVRLWEKVSPHADKADSSAESEEETNTTFDPDESSQ